jgi:hypothetical protein
VARGSTTFRFPVVFRNGLVSHLKVARKRALGGAGLAGRSGRKPARATQPVLDSPSPPQAPPSTVSYRRHVELAEASGESPWPREQFDAAVRLRGQEPVD